MATKDGSTRAKKQALDKALRGMFGKLQARPTPDRLLAVVDQLEAADEPRPKRVRQG